MKKYTLVIELLSPAHIGSGDGFGAIIDSDVIFDELGIPYIPAKRVKGCLRDSAMEVCEFFNQANVPFSGEIDKLFGKPGGLKSAPVFFSNLYLPQYHKNKMWLKHFIEDTKFGNVVTSTGICETFTEIRQQTRISSSGIAQEGSLRTIRVVNEGLIFEGDIFFEEEDATLLRTLVFACMNCRSFGTTRNRGFGEIHCYVRDEQGKVDMQNDLEEICS